MDHFLLLCQHFYSHHTALHYPLSTLLSITSLNWQLVILRSKGYLRASGLMPRTRLLQNSFTLQALVGDLQVRQHTLLWSWSCCGCCLPQHLQDCHTLKVRAPYCKCQGHWKDHSLPPAVVLEPSNPLLLVLLDLQGPLDLTVLCHLH
ncbi:hypothetical protein O3P69_018228 [Scylla paramamosain]